MRQFPNVCWAVVLCVVLFAAGCVAPMAPTTTAPEPEEAEPAKAEPKPEPKPIKHDAVGAKVTASSESLEWPGEGPPSSVTDGDLSTRWSSAHTAPQELTIDLGKKVKLAKLRLHWERASAREYVVQVSSDGETWKDAATKTVPESEQPAARVDELSLDKQEASAIRILMKKRENPEWGFSLYEAELHLD